MTVLFVSDLHLSAERPEKLSLFKQLMQGPAKTADAFYILGDLFDQFWIGCDDSQSPNPEIITILKDYTSTSKTPLFIIRGNRDFHLDSQFAEITGCHLIDDPSEIRLNDEKILLMHGDTLCTDDTKYQQWRCFITHPFVKWIYALFPLGFRKHIAHNVRSYTAEAVRKKSAEITDVSQKTVVNTMQQHKVQTIIHGHTHRQAMHEFDLDGKNVRRIVLGDWYEQDCILIYDETGFRFERVENYIRNTN